MRYHKNLSLTLEFDLREFIKLDERGERFNRIS